MILESLLGTSVADPDLSLRCDIMFPDGEVMTLGFEVELEPRSRLFEKRGEPESVGVGGVFTIIGAGSCPGGGGGGV